MVKDFEITLAQSARDCRVTIDGEPMRVTRCVITADIHGVATRFELDYNDEVGRPKVITAYGPRPEPVVITAQMAVDDESDGEPRLAWRDDGTPLVHSCGRQAEEVTHFASPNKQYRCPACQGA